MAYISFSAILVLAFFSRNHKQAKEATEVLRLFFDSFEYDYSISAHLMSAGESQIHHLNVTDDDAKASLVYAIIQSPKKMRVHVVFEGSASRFDWWKNAQILKVRTGLKAMNKFLLIGLIMAG